jgi:predicted PurR-regulated permease PerM
MESNAATPRPRGAVVFFLAVLGVAVGLFGYLLWDFATDLLLGFLIASAVRHRFLWLTEKLGGRPALAAALTSVAVAVLVAVPAIMFLTSLSKQAAVAYEAVRASMGLEAVQHALEPDGWVGRRAESITALLGLPYHPASLRDAATQGAGSVATYFAGQLNVLIANMISALYHFALMLVVLFFGLIDGPAIKRRVFTLSPLPDEEEELIVKKFKDVGAAIFIGNGVSSALQGTFGGVAMALAGLPSPLFWGVMMTIFAFLPLIGVAAVSIPATLYLVLIDRVPSAIVFFTAITLVSAFVENVVKPKLMGNRMQMHGMLIFFALLGGISCFGIAGLLYGPLVAAFFLTVIDLYERSYRERLLASS